MNDNCLPQNGRVVIVDDQLNQVNPLMRVLAKNSMPYVYVDPSRMEEYCPDEPYNDVRLLFLDLNLTGNRALEEKNVRSSLFAVLKRIVSVSNFPYVIVLWSVQENDYKHVLEDLFINELSDRKPIAIYPFIKSDFFPTVDGDEVEVDKDLLEEVSQLLVQQLAYCAMLKWENATHRAADSVLDQVYKNGGEWVNRAGYILETLSKAYYGKHYNELSGTERMRGAMYVFNLLFTDSLDSEISKIVFDSSMPTYDDNGLKKELICSELNSKLCIASDFSSQEEPGVVLVRDADKYCCKLMTLINTILSRKMVCIRFRNENPDLPDEEFKNLVNTEASKLRHEILSQAQPIFMVVTPACDYAQNKMVVHKMIEGVLVPSQYQEYLNRGEAIFVSPCFEHNGMVWNLVLDYRCLVTSMSVDFKYLTPLFKVRRQLLAEIQSQMSRHANRQGILNVQ